MPCLPVDSFTSQGSGLKAGSYSWNLGGKNSSEHDRRGVKTLILTITGKLLTWTHHSCLTHVCTSGVPKRKVAKFKCWQLLSTATSDDVLNVTSHHFVASFHMPKLRTCERPLSELLSRFFVFYAETFAWGSEVVSIRTGRCLFLGGGESVRHFQFMLPMPCLKRLVCVFFLNQAYVGIGCRLFHLAREASQPTSCGRSVFASESELRALTWKRGGLWEDPFFWLWKLGFSATGNAEKIRRSLCRGVPQTKTGACRDDYSAARCARSIPSGLSGSPGIETRCGRQTKERWRKAFVHTPELRGWSSQGLSIRSQEGQGPDLCLDTRWRVFHGRLRWTCSRQTRKIGYGSRTMCMERLDSMSVEASWCFLGRARIFFKFQRWRYPFKGSPASLCLVWLLKVPRCLWKSVDRILFPLLALHLRRPPALLEIWIHSYLRNVKLRNATFLSCADADKPIYAGGGLLEKVMIEVCDSRSGNKQDH